MIKIEFPDFKLDLRRSLNAKKGLLDLCEYIGMENMDLGVEIGSFSGVSAFVFSHYIKKLFCVDPWKSNYDSADDASDPSKFNMEEVENQFNEIMHIRQNIHKLKMPSLDAVSKFENHSLDFVYIDGEHTEKAEINDINAWLRKVKPGGWLCGHDYQPRFQGVIDAVNKLIGVPKKIFRDTSWCVQM